MVVMAAAALFMWNRRRQEAVVERNMALMRAHFQRIFVDPATIRMVPWTTAALLADASSQSGSGASGSTPSSPAFPEAPAVAKGDTAVPPPLLGGNDGRAGSEAAGRIRNPFVVTGESLIEEAPRALRDAEVRWV